MLNFLISLLETLQSSPAKKISLFLLSMFEIIISVSNRCVFILFYFKTFEPFLINSDEYINLNPLIKNSKYLDKNTPTLITSITTKEAGRQIFKKLINLGVKNITLPAINS